MQLRLKEADVILKHTVLRVQKKGNNGYESNVIMSGHGKWECIRFETQNVHRLNRNCQRFVGWVAWIRAECTLNEGVYNIVKRSIAKPRERTNARGYSCEIHKLLARLNELGMYLKRCLNSRELFFKTTHVLLHQRGATRNGTTHIDAAQL